MKPFRNILLLMLEHRLAAAGGESSRANGLFIVVESRSDFGSLPLFINRKIEMSAKRLEQSNN